MTKDRMLQASEAGPATLVNISLDLQIIICTLLHPSDILALRETCKALQLPTRQRVVWVAALHRVCLDNYLFLPSFPILDMSDAELEHAAMAPRRWIELCAAFKKKRHPNNSGATLRPRTTRIIEHSRITGVSYPEIFIVPGGRYMVSCSLKGLFVWDLGYTSNADCKLIASVGLEGRHYDRMVQATPDGMGLIIISSDPYGHCSVYEIYPQSETPQLTRIAHLYSDHVPMKPWAWSFPDRVLWYRCTFVSIIFTVWDYRANHSISFSASLGTNNFGYNLEVIATKTAVFLLCVQEISVWAIPPLLPQPPGHNSTHIPPLFGIAYPDGILRDGDHPFVASQTMSDWYSGPSQPLYFGIFRRDSKLRIFEIIIKPDLFDTSLHIINTELVSHEIDDLIFQIYSICEDTLVSCWESDDLGQFEVYTRSRFTTAISHDGPSKMLLSSTVSGHKFLLCPASGRYVHLDQAQLASFESFLSLPFSNLQSINPVHPETHKLQCDFESDLPVRLTTSEDRTK